MSVYPDPLVLLAPEGAEVDGYDPATGRVKITIRPGNAGEGAGAQGGGWLLGFDAIANPVPAKSRGWWYVVAAGLVLYALLRKRA